MIDLYFRKWNHVGRRASKERTPGILLDIPEISLFCNFSFLEARRQLGRLASILEVRRPLSDAGLPLLIASIKKV